MINLNQYSEIIIWGASLSPNEIGGGGCNYTWLCDRKTLSIIRRKRMY